MGGAPTFPPGGEAWSGFSGPGFFSNDAMSSALTPGQMFSTMFNANASSPGQGGASDAGAGGMGYMSFGAANVGQNQSWDMWGGDKDAGGNGNAMGMHAGQMGTTYYVNPNAQNMGHRGMSQMYQQSSQTTQQQRPDESPRTRPNVSIPPPINVNTVGASPAGRMTAPPIPSPRSSIGQFPSDSADPRRRATMPGSAVGGGPGQNGNANANANANGTGSMPTSALFPPFSVDAGGFQFAPDFTDPSKPIASTINIASSSTAPYAPPSNTQQLLTAPIAPAMAGPSLAEGPGLYSTTGFDMVGVLARVASRKDPKTVLGPVDLSCSFAVVVCLLPSDYIVWKVNTDTAGRSKIRLPDRVCQSNIYRFDWVRAASDPRSQLSILAE
jgi:hypothetical protein